MYSLPYGKFFFLIEYCTDKRSQADEWKEQRDRRPEGRKFSKAQRLITDQMKERDKKKKGEKEKQTRNERN